MTAIRLGMLMFFMGQVAAPEALRPLFDFRQGFQSLKGHRLKIIRSIVLVLVGLLLAFVVFLAGSVIVDALIGGNRVEQLTNTEIAGPDGQTIRAYVARPDAPGTYPGVVMIHEFFGEDEQFYMSTGVREAGGKVAMGSLNTTAIAWFDL